MEKTIAHDLLKYTSQNTKITSRQTNDMPKQKNTFYVSIIGDPQKDLFSLHKSDIPAKKEWVLFYIVPGNCAWLLSSKPNFLFMAYQYVLENFDNKDFSHSLPG